MWISLFHESIIILFILASIVQPKEITIVKNCIGRSQLLIYLEVCVEGGFKLSIIRLNMETNISNDILFSQRYDLHT